MIPAEHQEAADQVAKEQARQLDAMDATVANSRSITAVNQALVKLHEARAGMRVTFANIASVGAVLAIGWSVWAWVHWA